MVDTLLQSVVVNCVKLRFLAAIAQLYQDSLFDAATFCGEQGFRNHTQFAAAPHYSLHPP